MDIHCIEQCDNRLSEKKRPALSLDADMMMDDGDSVPREIKDDSRGPEELACEDDFARYVMSKLEGASAPPSAYSH